MIGTHRGDAHAFADDTDTPIPGDEIGGWDPDQHRDTVDALVLLGEWSLDDQEIE